MSVFMNVIVVDAIVFMMMFERRTFVFCEFGVVVVNV